MAGEMVRFWPAHMGVCGFVCRCHDAVGAIQPRSRHCCGLFQSLALLSSVVFLCLYVLFFSFRFRFSTFHPPILLPLRSLSFSLSYLTVSAPWLNFLFRLQLLSPVVRQSLLSSRLSKTKHAFKKLYISLRCVCSWHVVQLRSRTFVS